MIRRLYEMKDACKLGPRIFIAHWDHMGSLGSSHINDTRLDDYMAQHEHTLQKHLTTLQQTG